MIKVLFCGLKHEYGRSNWGLSFEYQNFYEVLRCMEGVEAEMFAVDEIIREVGKDEMNKQLIKQVQENSYNLLFCFLFTEELKKETIEFITKKTKTKTFNWFADDHWRFPIYSRFWAPLFTTVSTTDSEAISKYHHLGIKNVIKTQWAANIELYKPISLPPLTKGGRGGVDEQINNNYQISFVGKKYGNRGKYIAYLKNHSLPAKGFGKGWKSGVVGFNEMINVFANSKVNLNFTESPYVTFKNRIKLFTKLFIKKELGRYKLNVHHLFPNIYSAIGAQRRQIKARIFEVPACGGFLLTGGADNLDDYYEEDKEIVVFDGFDDLAEKCKYYLEHEQERQTIAKAGYERTIKEHTYEQRFAEVFKSMDLLSRGSKF